MRKLFDNGSLFIGDRTIFHTLNFVVFSHSPSRETWQKWSNLWHINENVKKNMKFFRPAAVISSQFNNIFYL